MFSVGDETAYKFPEGHLENCVFWFVNIEHCSLVAIIYLGILCGKTLEFHKLHFITKYVVLEEDVNFNIRPRELLDEIPC